MKRDIDMAEVLQSDSKPLFVIAGPCVIESAELCLEVGRVIKAACDQHNVAYVFKASFDKANRSSGSSFRGPGVGQGLAILEKVKSDLGVPVLTDVHEREQAAVAAEVVDVLQVPAFLARQTDLLAACGNTGCVVNIKKGQFMAPVEMHTAAEKVFATGNRNVMLTERGTFFGYGRLVSDFTGLAVMQETDCPVVFDVTHSTQQPAGLGGVSGGQPEYAPMLARAAVAAGVDGIFLEAHPEPTKAKSDAASMLHLEEVP
ncbi:MAG: 3-deoxy-8-phosphooctulonate synthase, partial [Planctomycetota bacterium]